MASILAFFQALPKLLELAEKLGAWLTRVSGGDIPGFLNRASEAFEFLDQADTPEKKADAAKRLARLIGGM